MMLRMAVQIGLMKLIYALIWMIYKDAGGG